MGIKFIPTAAVFMFVVGFALILQKGDWNRVCVPRMCEPGVSDYLVVFFRQ